MQCNKIRVIHQRPNVVVTHSDVPELYLWDFDRQPDLNATKARPAPSNWICGVPIMGCSSSLLECTGRYALHCSSTTLDAQR